MRLYKASYISAVIGLLRMAVIASGLTFTACNGGSSAATPAGDSNDNLSELLIIEKAGVVPVLNGKPTAAGVYIHNDSDHEISDIQYQVVDIGQRHLANISLNALNECSRIKAGASCLLRFTTPALKPGQKGSSLIAARFAGLQNKELVNYEYTDSSLQHGVSFSSGSTTLYGSNDFTTVYSFVGENKALSNVEFVSSSNSLSVANQGNTTTINFGVNQVVPLELHSNQVDASISATITPQIRSELKSGELAPTEGVGQVLSVVVTPTSQAYLLMSSLPFLSNDSESQKSAILTITNSGNKNVAGPLSLVQKGGQVLNATNSSSCFNLAIGATCSYTISLKPDLVSNGSVTLELNYDSNNPDVTELSKVSQVVYYYTNSRGPFITLTPSPTTVTLASSQAGPQAPVTFTVENTGDSPLINAQFSSKTISTLLQFSADVDGSTTCTGIIEAHSSCIYKVYLGISNPVNSMSSGTYYLELKGSFSDGQNTYPYEFISNPVAVNFGPTGTTGVNISDNITDNIYFMGLESIGSITATLTNTANATIPPQNIAIFSNQTGDLLFTPSPAACLLYYYNASSKQTTCTFNSGITPWDSSAMNNGQTKTYTLSILNNGGLTPSITSITYQVKAPTIYLPQTGQTPSSPNPPADLPSEYTDGYTHSGIAWAYNPNGNLLPETRFVKTGTGDCATIEDKLTGLIWLNNPTQFNSGNKMNFQTALNIVTTSNNSNLCGANNWRLPNYNEMRSLVNYRFSQPRTYLTTAAVGFESVVFGEYWTSSLGGGTNVSPPTAYAVSLSNFVGIQRDVNTTCSMFLVRSSATYSTAPAKLAATGQSNTAPSSSLANRDGSTPYGVNVLSTSRFVAGVGSGVDCKTDIITGLMWSKPQKFLNGALTTFDAASSAAASLNLCGFTDWRLPNINELMSLVIIRPSASVDGPVDPYAQLNASSRFGTGQFMPDQYWTSTLMQSNSTSNVAVDMANGKYSAAVRANPVAYGIAVRGGVAMNQ